MEGTSSRRGGPLQRLVKNYDINPWLLNLVECIVTYLLLEGPVNDGFYS
jgi:hypothetical protein